MKYKILNTIGPVFTDKAKTELAKLGEVEYCIPSQEELVTAVAPYHIVVVGLGLRFDRAVLEGASHLRLIAIATTGLDHIDVEYAQSRGIEVISLKGETAFLDTITGTAELAAGLMLDLMREISAAGEAVKKYQWDREQFRGHTLYGKTLGIVGFGRLGKMMARFGRAFGMEVLAQDPQPDQNFCKAHDVRVVSFDVLVKQSDVISIHMPLNRATENMFSEKTFAQMKPTAYLINTARGKIVNESDLLAALKRGGLAGYAADVMAEEVNFGKIFSIHPLVEYAKTHFNVLITPHIGGMTHESRAATDVFIANKVAQWAVR